MKESSEVLARKYRPSNFDELIGQESIAQTLSLALDASRLSHAYLFSGLRGSGKTSTARIFAKALVCDMGVSHSPCGTCSQCIMAKENRHIDIIEMDAASSRKIDDIRDLIEQTKYRPNMARFKIFIIDEVHMLTKEAFNALLKTLEEPPSYVKFILATTDPLKLPATILSRTQHFRFKRIANTKIVSHLAHILHLENIEYETSALEILARSGSGSLRDTLTLLDQAIIYSKGFVDVKTVTDMLGLVDPNFLQEILSAVFAKDYAKIIEHIKVLESYEAEVVVDELIAYLKERLFANDPLYSTLILDRFFRILSDAKQLFSINAESFFTLSLIFFKMIEALRIKEIDQLIDSLHGDIQHAPAEARPVLHSMALTQNIQKDVITQEMPQPESTRFSQLLAKIQDRNAELGACFGEHVTFVSFTEQTLTLQSSAQNLCKEKIRHGYPVIKAFIQELFGRDTLIKVEQQQPQKEPEAPIEAPQVQQSSSSYDDMIAGSGSCVTGCEDSQAPTQEIERDAIHNEPMVQKAIELFEAKKLTVQSKI